jgi:hypothetical protein
MGELFATLQNYCGFEQEPHAAHTTAYRKHDRRDTLGMAPVTEQPRWISHPRP